MRNRGKIEIDKKAIISTIACLVLLAGTFAAGFFINKYKLNQGNNSSLSQSQIESLPGIPSDEIDISTPQPPSSSLPSSSSSSPATNQTGEIRGVWVASVLNLDFPSNKALSSAKLKGEIDTIINTARSANLNAIFFQVRPASDALYKSDIFPTSYWLTGAQGAPLQDSFDPLAYAVEQAHKKGMQLHAWVNPYRVTMGDTFNESQLSANNPAKLHPEWTVKHTDGKVYYNPGIPEVRKLIIDGVAEIVQKYNVDGVHYDDYFYPSKDSANFNDNAAFAANPNGFANKDDWRRNNNNLLIKDTYNKVKSIKANVQFGVSPFGIWASKGKNALGSDTSTGTTQSYYSLYADSRKWVKQGWLDYICPQLYWSYDKSGSSYKVLCDWWSNVVSGTKVKLFIGHAAYKLNSDDNDWKNPDEITKQIAYARAKKGYGGSVFFRYGNIKENLIGIKDLLTSFYAPAASKTTKLIIPVPSNNATMSSDKTFIMGASDQGSTLKLNGKTVEDRTNSGLFSVYVDLKVGANTFTFQNGSQTYKMNINRSSAAFLYMSSFKILSCYPDNSELVRLEGEEITLTARAPAGSTVWAELDGQKIEMTTDVKPPSNGRLLAATYTGKYIMPPKANGGIASLGKPVFYAQGFSKDAVREAISEIKVQSPSYKRVGTLIADYSWLRPTPYVDKLFESFTANKSLADYITGQEYLYDEKNQKNLLFMRFASGLWTESAKVNVQDNGTVTRGGITSAQFKNTNKSTILTLKSPQNNPVQAVCTGDMLELHIYNAAGFENKLPVLPDNPLFTSVSGRTEGNKYIYAFALKKQDYYFGYSVNYENGSIIVSFKNPCKIVSVAKPLTGIKIALDPGHGIGSGALGPDGTSGILEKDMNYYLASKVKEHLESYGAAVIMTREQNSGTKELDAIQLFYRQEQPDLALSIHHNSVDYSRNPITAFGAETYYATMQSKKAAEIILDSSCKYAQRTKREAIRGDYIVSRIHELPAVLLEAGFMCNIYEYEWLCQPQNRDYYAESISLSIIDYFKWQNN